MPAARNFSRSPRLRRRASTPRGAKYIEGMPGVSRFGRARPRTSLLVAILAAAGGAAGEGVVAPAEGERHRRAALRVSRRDLVERMRPAVAASQHVRRELVRQSEHFEVLQQVPEPPALFLREVFHRLWRARHGGVGPLYPRDERAQWVERPA